MTPYFVIASKPTAQAHFLRKETDRHQVELGSSPDKEDRNSIGV